MDTFSLKSKVVLVTGGAGRYGRQIVAAVAEAGARTYIASRNLEALKSFEMELRDNELDVTALQMDQSDESSILNVRDTILAKSGRIDILVNNVVSRPMKDGYKKRCRNLRRKHEGKRHWLFMITRAMGDVLESSGSIINVGSMQKHTIAG